MGLSVVLDGGLNPLLIAGIGPFPRLGIAGSATATLIANVVAVLALAAYVHLRDLPLRLKGHELRYLLPQPALVRLVIGKGLPIGAQMIVISVGGLAMMGLVNRHGIATVAAYGITLQLWAYIQMPALAIGAAVSSMAAQNIGAGKWDRVAEVTRSGLLYNGVMTGALVAAVMLFARPVFALFIRGTSPAIGIAEHISLLSTWSFILFGATMVLFGVVRANGAVWGPLLILFVAMFPVRLGFALALAPVIGADALWWSFPLGSATNLVLAAAYYRYGPWRRGRMVVPAETDAGAMAKTSAGALEPAG
jgi:Na+-driven multidrug efflux pump